MKENQHVEWKASWRDEYLQWICAFANSSGGTLTIGKSDQGTIIGILNATRLSEDLPNKITHKLGIVADVNLLTDGPLEYIEIYVKPYPNPISYDGRYYVRVGSTKQTLNGEALTRFLLSKASDSWESTLLIDIQAEDFDAESLRLFKKRVKNTNRINIPEDKGSEQVFERFSLMNNGKINRAGYLLFYENPHQLIIGAFIKIAYFNSETNILFQDVVEGSIFHQIDKTIDLLHTKYVIKTIDFQGFSGVETFPYAERALREALMNAIAHRDYSKGNPIQIKVFKDKVILFNEGSIPVDWTEEEFLGPHSSKPRNPIIANVLYNAGLIERWGLGIQTIIKENENLGIKVPEFKYGFEDFEITLFAIRHDKQEYNTLAELSVPLPEKPDIAEFHSFFELKDAFLSLFTSKPFSESELKELRATSLELSQKSLDIVTRLDHFPKKRRELLQLVGLTNQTFNFQTFLVPLIEKGILDYTIKDRKTSSNQRYFLTSKGFRYKEFLLMVLEHLNN